MIRLTSRQLIYLLSGLFLVCVGALFSHAPIPQDQSYHHFADQRDLLGIPNALNVLSNLPFLLVGLLGLWRPNATSNTRVHLQIFYFGVALVAFGSGYYHWHPDNQTLVYDRLPMTIAFMALFSLMLSERLPANFHHLTLALLLIVGIGSVLYWQWTERQGHGDLRPYALVQFFPMLGMLVLLIFSDKAHGSSRAYWWLFSMYVVAKLLEYFDIPVFHVLGNVVSGHSLKHIVAATGIYLFWQLW